MEKLVLKVEKRDNSEKLSELRSSRIIPGIVYGHNKEATMIKVDNSSLLRTYRSAWENHIVTLELDGENIDVLFHEIQKDPITWDFLHVDFLSITKWEKITARIPLVFVWNSKAKADWAIIEELIKEIEVKCLPTDLVDNFEVDLSLLEKVWDNIKVSDLNIDSKFEILNNKDDVLANAVKPKVETETEADTNSDSDESVNEK